MSNVTQYAAKQVPTNADLDLFAERIKTYIEPMLFGEQVGYVDSIMEAHYEGEPVRNAQNKFRQRMSEIERVADFRWGRDYNLLDKRVKAANHMLYWFYTCVRDGSNKSKVSEALKKIHQQALRVMLPDEYNKVFG